MSATVFEYLRYDGKGSHLLDYEPLIEVNPRKLPFVGELAKYAHYGENYV